MGSLISKPARRKLDAENTVKSQSEKTGCPAEAAAKSRPEPVPAGTSEFEPTFPGELQPDEQRMSQTLEGDTDAEKSSAKETGQPISLVNKEGEFELHADAVKSSNDEETYERPIPATIGEQKGPEEELQPQGETHTEETFDEKKEPDAPPMSATVDEDKKAIEPQPQYETDAAKICDKKEPISPKIFAAVDEENKTVEPQQETDAENTPAKKEPVAPLLPTTVGEENKSVEPQREQETDASETCDEKEPIAPPISAIVDEENKTVEPQEETVAEETSEEKKPVDGEEKLGDEPQVQRENSVTELSPPMPAALHNHVRSEEKPSVDGVEPVPAPIDNAKTDEEAEAKETVDDAGLKQEPTAEQQIQPEAVQEDAPCLIEPKSQAPGKSTKITLVEQEGKPDSDPVNAEPNCKRESAIEGENESEIAPNLEQGMKKTEEPATKAELDSQTEEETVPVNNVEESAVDELPQPSNKVGDVPFSKIEQAVGKDNVEDEVNNVAEAVVSSAVNEGNMQVTAEDIVNDAIEQTAKTKKGVHDDEDNDDDQNNEVVGANGHQNGHTNGNEYDDHAKILTDTVLDHASKKNDFTQLIRKHLANKCEVQSDDRILESIDRFVAGLDFEDIEASMNRAVDKLFDELRVDSENDSKGELVKHLLASNFVTSQG